MLDTAKSDSPYCTIGVMIDFLCLLQKPFASGEEKTRFKRSLSRINEWYYHKYTSVLLVTTPPPVGAEYGNMRLHSQRGWCDFELCASMVVKGNGCLLDWSQYRGATGFDCKTPGEGTTCVDQMQFGRKPPWSPAVFGERMRQRVVSDELKFTANADQEFVIQQYETGFILAFDRVAAIESANDRRLQWENLGWGDADAEQMLEALRFAAQRCNFPHGNVTVDLGENPIEKIAKLSHAIDDLGDEAPTHAWTLRAGAQQILEGWGEECKGKFGFNYYEPHGYGEIDDRWGYR